MEAVIKALPAVRVPTARTRVYKDECAYSFQNQVKFPIFLFILFFGYFNLFLILVKESAGGLFVDMNSFLAYSPAFVEVRVEASVVPCSQLSLS